MKHLHYKKQQFQQDAVNSVCDVFEGEIGEISQYILGKKKSELDGYVVRDKNIYAYKNEKIGLPEDILLKNLKKVQKRNGFIGEEIATTLDKNNINLTVEMETGTGKTYTYINTIFELNKRYNWTKFIIVVPSIAIREGVYKSFEDMEYHFKSEYGKTINYFIFNSQKINDVMSFARDDGINVMIINNQAFNKKESNTIHNSDNEYGLAPIEYIQTTNPIMIIDEPQTVEGKNKSNKTRLTLSEFNPLFTLRYSATHRESYNMVYKLDAVDAFNQKLVKRIEVNGIEIKGSTATHGYFLVDDIILTRSSPKARIEIDITTSKRKIKTMEEGDNIYEKYAQLEQYKGWVIDRIDGINNCIIVRTPNGDKTFYKGSIYGEPNNNYKKRIQIRETIKSHLKKEALNYKHGIKTISLFFIDEVKKYRQYDDGGAPINGEYAEIFIEEYNNILPEFIKEYPHLKEYIEKIPAEETHSGYFSIDKKKKQLKDPKLSGRGKEKVCNDVDAFELIMKDKKRLLDLKNPVRFIFSHSALKEGWDNPNVFQICILRDNESSNIKRKQEVGRGLRLCVNQDGERIDNDFEGIDVNKINILTIIANESYESFAGALQSEFSENLRNRPVKFTTEFLKTQKLNGQPITDNLADEIHYDFIANKYIDREGKFTDKFFEDLENDNIKLDESLQQHSEEIKKLAKKIIDNKVSIEKPKPYITATLKPDKLDTPEFDKLWNYINSKSYYTVNFDTNELIKKASEKINNKLIVSSVYVESIRKITKDKQDNGIEFQDVDGGSNREKIKTNLIGKTKFDLISQIVDKTRLTKTTIVEILSKINKDKFELFNENPEEFIKNISELINEEKAKIIVKNIEYHKTDEKLSKDIFENRLDLNRDKYIETPYKYIYDRLEYDSVNPEKEIGEKMDINSDLLVFAKLPKNKYNIETPIENFSPDWLMVFKEGTATYAYCVFESKGSLKEIERREIENIKIECAKKHFKAISDGNIKFEAVSSVEDVINNIGLTNK